MRILFTVKKKSMHERDNLHTEKKREKQGGRSTSIETLEEKNIVHMIIVFVYLYSAPTVEEFFDGIDATLAKRPFNSAIALAGCKP